MAICWMKMGVEFILNTVKDIGEKITKDDPVSDVKELIGQYYISS